MTSKTWPVVELFGSTIQGEGVDQGVVTHFVRFGGCDFRCSWCLETPPMQFSPMRCVRTLND